MYFVFLDCVLIIGIIKDALIDGAIKEIGWYKLWV